MRAQDFNTVLKLALFNKYANEIDASQYKLTRSGSDVGARVEKRILANGAVWKAKMAALQG